MSTIDKKRLFIVVGCIFLIIVVVILSVLYLKNQYTETVPKFLGTANLVSSKIDTVEEDDEKEEAEPIVLEKDEEITIYNSSEELISLNASGWTFQDTSFDGEYETDGLIYYYEAFSVERDDDKIIRIIFNENYKTDIVSGIKVGMELDDVKEKLGKPIFEDEEMIGYKTKNLYLCIYEDEIVAYQNQYYTNEKIEEMILKYVNQEYSGTRNDFSKYIRNNYSDFNFSVDEEENICLTSLVRGVVIKLGKFANDITVECYKEYDSANLILNQIPESIIETKEYLFKKMEDERNSEG